MKPLRIGLFTDTFLPDQNGIVTSVGLLSDELRARGHHVDVVAPFFPEQQDTRPDVRRAPSVRYVFLPTYRLAWPTRKDFEQKYDLIHTHTPLTLGLAGARLARKWDVPHVATYHTHIEAYTHYVPGLTLLQKQTRVVTRLMGLYYRRADAVITPTAAMLDVTHEMGVRNPVVIPTSVEPEVLRSAPPVDTPWPAGTRRLLTVGRLAREKRFDLVLDTLAQLPDAHLVILGEGPEREHLVRHTERLGIADRVTFLGVKPWTEIGAYYRLAELFLFASDTETQGLVLQEAQLMGVPVVAVGARGTLSGVAQGKSGYLVAPGDVAALTRHARAILGDGMLWRRLSEGARSFGTAWTPGGVAERVLDVYAGVLGVPREVPFPAEAASPRNTLAYDR
ncbi:glycosyltransferase family 4 protein [Deinococcus metallilatus]|uniref:Glycosyltransferase family 4 protein n=1 Tax=Deinococcus metallilatus TaxID=1211322 RepID=A0AAJ5JY49_9DEIO|nr:glycosyltransferase family 4 protein [Deinococcus metallilatus]MBB5295860.1 glycosyltransferase involved in cell wall biosynthesis [Deinococcus metallilatus]QBY08299.1 glycosyltransferase family 4 protein [Deinococcus metallilatus]RXJ12030.1 glycosyltransferase family 4 protein [Deinococcus metallilatus]TLK25738.1 glycosyltransferase family 4 protein [Deinococcus metallilatus]GMA14609.1 mannosyltransferase [Deinococcus metallilatus]